MNIGHKWPNQLFNIAFFACLSLLVGIAPTLSGCAGNQTINTVLEDTSDPCYAERKAVAGHQSHFAEDIVTGAIIGAVSGAVIGALTASASKKDVGKGAAVGAAAGAVVGGIGGYYNALQRQQGQTPNMFYSQLLNDVSEENRKLSALNQDMDRLLACRRHNADSIRQAYKRKLMVRTEAERQMTELRGRLAKDVELANSIRADLGKRANDLQFAGMKVAPDRVGYVDIEAQKTGSGGKKKQTKATAKKTAPPSEVQQAMAESGPPPAATTKEERKLIANIAQSTSQLQDNAVSFNTSTAKLESLADSGLELDTPRAGTLERATRLLALVSPEDRGCTLMANRLASA